LPARSHFRGQYSSLFMPIIANAAGVYPTLQADLEQHQAVRALVGEEDWLIIVDAFRLDFESRGVHPFNDGTEFAPLYHYLEADVQEDLLLPRAGCLFSDRNVRSNMHNNHAAQFALARAAHRYYESVTGH